MVLYQLDIQMEKKNLDTCLTLYTETNSKWTIDLQVKVKQ